MLMNNLDPEVAERPNELVVYGGIGRAARDWESFDRIVASLRSLEDDETLLVQSGKPVGIFRTHADAPRVLIANSNLVPGWATWDHFHALDRLGLMMYGQMTAGSWIYIGSQGIVQGTYETFAEVARRHFGGSLKGKWILTGGLGGMGGAQPLAATMAGASMIAVECQPSRIEMRLRTRYLDARPKTIDEALEMIERRAQGGQADLRRPPRQCGRDLPRSGAPRHPARCGHRPDLRPRPLNGYLPAGWTLARMGRGARARPEERSRPPPSVHGDPCEAPCSTSTAWACRPSTTATTSARWPRTMGVADAFDFPGFVPAYIRPLFCRGIGPFRWASLTGDPEDIAKTDARVKELIPDDAHLHNWLDMAKERIAFQGLPARICWVGLGDRHRLGLAFNEMVAKGEIGAHRHRPRPPRFRLRRLPQPRDRGDEGRLGRRVRLAAAQRPPQHRLGRDLGVAAPWRRRRHGLFAAFRRGHRRRRHAGGGRAPRAACCGTTPATGVMRHADAGYDIAVDCARQKGLKLPALGIGV
jgi:urocanate hydratase